MDERTPTVEVFPASSPPGLVPHNDFIEAAFIKGNMGGLVVIKLRAGELSAHSHEQEHVGVVLAGSFELITDDGAVQLQAGDVYRVPPNLRHGIRCANAALIVQARA